MASRKLSVAACVCTLVLACSSKSSPPPSSATGAPPGSTPATAPYATCSNLAGGSYTVTGDYATPATTSCSAPGGPTSGSADSHCVGQTPQTVSGGSCGVADAGSGDDDDSSAGDAGAAAGDDAGSPPAPGPCGENGSDFGATMYGTEGNDDDCKYHVSYTATPICENNGTYFVVTANYLTRGGAPLTGASTLAEICLSDTHSGPAIDARPPFGAQEVVEGPPGTYTIGPVQFDAPGDWTVRFHFNEFCCDAADDSPHGHAAFHVTVP